MSSNQFDTKVAGIPCICEVTAYRPAVPDRISGRWEDAEQGSDSEFEFNILDRRGRRAPWLERKLTDKDHERLEEEWEATVLEHKHMINERDD